MYNNGEKKMKQSDEELMLNYRDGDDNAFEMLYHRYEKPILDFIYRMVMNAEDAENLCQETFFRMVRGKRRYQATACFKTWLFRIALFRWYFSYRRRNFHRKLRNFPLHKANSQFHRPHQTCLNVTCR